MEKVRNAFGVQNITLLDILLVAMYKILTFLIIPKEPSSLFIPAFQISNTSSKSLRSFELLSRRMISIMFRKQLMKSKQESTQLQIETDKDTMIYIYIFKWNQILNYLMKPFNRICIYFCLLSLIVVVAILAVVWTAFHVFILRMALFPVYKVVLICLKPLVMFKVWTKQSV